MNRTAKLCALAVAVVLTALPAAAQQPRAGDEIEVIVVTPPEGARLRDYSLDFVLEIGDPPTRSNGYARWRRHICVGVVDAPAEGAQLVADRISDTARELGLSAGEPGCTPNLFVMFTTDGAALASGLVEASPLLFRPFGGDAGTTQGLSALADFQTSDAPVRWWQITMPVDVLGRPAIKLSVAAFSMPSAINTAPWVAGANSLIRNSVEDEIWRAYVIVDTRKIVGLSWVQVADYLAMISLAQVDPEGDASGYDSILNLFASPSSAQGLTEWDKAYLNGLYALDRRLLPRHQRGALANLVARDLEAGGAE